MPKISSDFAMLDVKEGREALHEHFASRPTFGECPEALRIPITITGYIDNLISADDGVSREFSVIVERIVL